MLAVEAGRLKLFVKRAFRVLLCVMLILQTLTFPTSALAATAFYFRGYDQENVTNSTFSYGSSGADVSGTTVSYGTSASGEAIGLVALNETGHDISTAVDLGGLEIDFSTVATTSSEGEGNTEVDVATVKIKFCDESGDSIGTVSLAKSDPAAVGSETLQSGASIPKNTREIYIYLYATSASGNNTVVFTNTSLVIHDSSAPSCSIDYNPDWTSQPVTVQVNAADSDSGLAGIYVNGEVVSTTSPYTTIVSSNNTTISAYSLDNAGKKSEVQTVTIANIDATAPAAPASLSLSTTDWSNADVLVMVPDLGVSTGSPERYVYQIGAGGWTDLPGGFALGDNGVTTIRVAVQDAAGNRSSALEATAKIDKIAPTISALTTTVSSGSCRVDFTVADGGLSGLKTVRYAEGTVSADYFLTGGTDITNGTFTVSKGGDYTICATDNAGNATLVNKALSTAPTLANIADETTNEDTLLHIDLTVTDAETALSGLTVTATSADTKLLPSIVVNKSDSGISLDIMPAKNQYGGPVLVTVTVEDPEHNVVSDSFNVTVISVNDAPSATDDTGYTLNEDSLITIDVLANDNDSADADTLIIDSCGEAANGTTLVVLGKIRYTPNKDFVGSDSFQYTVTDGNGGYASAYVYVTVTNINDAPIAQDDKAVVQEDNSVTINVLENDTDIDMNVVGSGETISISDLTDGTKGTTKREGDSIVYTPAANIFGTDSFTYTIIDKAGLTSSATVRITVSPEADDPFFTGLNDSYTIDEDSGANLITFQISDVETPADSLMLQAASTTTAKIAQSGIAIIGLGDTSNEVTLSVTPVANQYGEATIVLSLGDGFTTVQRTITITINNVNDAPRAGTDSVTFAEDTSYVDIPISTLLSNDTDIDSATLSFVGIKTQPSSGSILLLDDLVTLRYTPVANFDGETSFTYTLTDGTDTAVGTCRLIATGSNDAPTISFQDDTATTVEDTRSAAIPFEINDQETKTSSLVLIASSSNIGLVSPGDIEITNTGDGKGTITVLPQPDANGTVVITLIVSDGEANSNDTISLEITAAEDAPVAEDDDIYAHYSGARTFGVLENDHDIDGDVLSVKNHSAVGLPGTLTFDETTQQFTYVPAVGENGDCTFTYTVTDGTKDATATVTLHVASETHDPVLSPVNSQYVREDETNSNILFSVSDEDAGDTFQITVTSGNTAKLPQNDANISFTSLGEGKYKLSLTPVADCYGIVTVTITVEDAAGNRDSTSFTLHILAQNDAPVAQDGAVQLPEDGSADLNLLENDSDADGDKIWVTTVSTPAHGSLTRTQDEIIYSPYANWYGTEILTYGISDGRASDTASVTITVDPRNDAPIAWANYVALPNVIHQTADSINVLGNDRDPDGDTIYTYQIVSGPSYGDATINADGTITYERTVASDKPNGADSFVYRIIDRSDPLDANVLSGDATVYIGEVFNNSLNTYGKEVYCNEDCLPFEIKLDVENPSPVDYVLTVDETTTLGTFTVVSGKADTVLFTPAANAHGYDTIRYSVTDKLGAEYDTGTIWLTVHPVNDEPVITSAPTQVTVAEDAATHASFTVAFEDADCATRDLYFYVYSRSATTSAPVIFQTGYSVERTNTGAVVTVNPETNVNGNAVIVVGVSDGFTYTEKTVNLAITAVDDAPLVNNISRTINEDSSVCFAALPSDYEVDGDSTKVTIGTPQHGTAVLRADNTILYTPAADYFGSDSFYIKIADQTDAALYTTAQVSITVRAVNDQPQISGLGYYQKTAEDTQKDISLTVTDVDNDMSLPESYTFQSNNESVVDSDDISIVHVSGKNMLISVKPMANASGTALITVTASDGSLSANGAFLLTVTPVNDKPVAVDDTGTVIEAVSDGSETTPVKTTKILNLTGNDTDVENGTLRIVAITNVKNGSVVNTGDGNVTIYADGNSTEDVTFQYTVMDPGGETASASVKLTITPVNDPPSAADDSITIDEDATPTISVLTNDSDPEGEALTVKAVSKPDHGTASYTATGVSYVPEKDYNGKDSFTYTVEDASGASASATVNVVIRPINDAPEIAKHASNSGDWVMQEDTPKYFHFVVSDAESAVNNLIIRIVSKDETLVKTSQIQLSTNGLGYKTIYVVPNANAHGTVPVAFTVSDGLLSTTVTYNIRIDSVNDAPVVTPMQKQIKEDTVLSATALATDADGNDVTFSLVAANAPAHGTAVVNADGSFTYTPVKDFNGTDTFEIAAYDGQSENHTGTAYVTVEVTRENDPPTANDDEATILEDTPGEIDVLYNDVDQDTLYGDELTILRIYTQPAKGTATIADGVILYTPKLNQNGTDTFVYVVSDQDGKLDSATVTVTITAVNDAPENGNDTAQVNEDGSVSIDVLANDDVDQTTNPDWEHLTITGIEQCSNGVASLNADGHSITYKPNANHFTLAGHPDVFYYTVADKGDPALTGRFSVSVDVASVNDVPTITATAEQPQLQNVTMDEDTVYSAVSFTVFDVEDAANALTVTVSHNNTALLPDISVSPNASGVCSFDIDTIPNKVGTATITVTVKDHDGATAQQSFTLTVNATNDLPSATDDNYEVNESGTITKNVLVNDDVDILAGNSDGTEVLTLLGFVDGDGNTVSELNTTYGRATISNNQLVYVHTAVNDKTANYTDSFVYQMKEKSGQTDTATVTVTIKPFNDPPKISDTANVTGIQEDAVDGTGAIEFTVTDEETNDDVLIVTKASSNTTLFPLANITITNPSDDPTGSKRTVQVIPAKNQFGTATITLTVSDGVSSAVDTFTVEVLSVNDGPASGDDTAQVNEDTPITINVTANDDVDLATNPTTEKLTITSVTQPANGIAVISSDSKKITYTPKLNYFSPTGEPDTFTYTVHDNGTPQLSGTFNVSVTVLPVNDAPTIEFHGEDTYTVYEKTPVNDILFYLRDVDNNTDLSHGDSEVTVTAKSSNPVLLQKGIVIAEGAGSDRTISLQPYMDWNGTTTITLTATDKAGAKGTYQFVLVVNNVNAKPVAVSENASVPEDATSNVYVLSNDQDDDLTTNPDTEVLYVNSVSTQSTNASVSVAANSKSVVIDPIDNFNGVVTITYTIRDAAGAISDPVTSTITVYQVNDAPAPVNDSGSVDEDKTIDIAVLANDKDTDQIEGLNADYTAEVLSASISETDLVKPAHGTITIANNVITYDSNENYNGTDTFEYYCWDGEARTKATVNVTIKPVNDNPVAVKDTVGTDEDTSVTKDVIANDTDIDTLAGTNATPDDLTLLKLTGATVTTTGSGTITGYTDKTITFKPATDWFGTATVTYTMEDTKGGTATGILEITVKSINDLPVFTTAPADMELVEDLESGASALVVGDVETDVGVLSVTFEESNNTSLVDGSGVSITKGTEGNRTVTVNPKDNQHGTAIIKLRVTDGDKGYSFITFTVTVSAVNDVPVADDKTLNITEDSGNHTILATSVIHDNDILTDKDVVTPTITTQAQHGTASIVDGNIVYRANDNFNGTDSFVYTATDILGDHDTGTVTVNISQVNDAPAPVNDSDSVDEDKTIDIAVLANDKDTDQIEGLNADYTAEVLSASISETDLVKPAHGKITIANNVITYDSNENYNGTDSFEYYCWDGEARTKATVNVTIKPVNDNPIAVKDTIGTDEDTSVTKDVIANDTDIDTVAGTNATPDDLTLLKLTGATVTTTGSGTITGYTDKTITFKPATDWFGTATVTYTMEDTKGGTATGILEITVKSINDLPVFTTAPADMELVEDLESGASALVVGDVETDVGVLSVTFEESNNTSLVDGSGVSITKGTEGNRTVTVNPKDNQHGTAIIKLRVTDGDKGYSFITFTVTVSAVNDVPVADNQTLNIAEDSGNHTILATSVIHDNDILTDKDVVTPTITTQAQHGTASIVDGNIVYRANDNFNGTDSFVYTATDILGDHDTGTVTVNISQVNDAPAPVNDSDSVDEDKTIDIAVLANDKDTDQIEGLNSDYTAEVLSASIAETDLVKPAHGTITIANNVITYDSNENYNGTDTFEYYCWDGEARTKATVNVTIKPVNDNPIAVEDGTTTDEDTAVTYNVLANDTDIDTVAGTNASPDSKNSFRIDSIAFSGGTHGTISFLGGEITYTPSANYTGTQVITYQMSDGHGGTSSSKLTILVGSEEDSPIAKADVMNTSEDHAVTINVLDNDLDNDVGDTLRFTGFVGDISSVPGTFTTNTNGSVTFTPDTNYNGSFTVTYQIKDSTNLPATADITITVSAVNDKPVALDTNATTQEDTDKTVDVASLISDADIETNDDAIVVSIAVGNEPAHGSYLLDGTVITYQPDADFNGTDSITYTVTDKLGETDTGIIALTIDALNDAPVAKNDTAETNEDTPVTILVLKNDYDMDSFDSLNAVPDKTMNVVSVGTAAHGTPGFTAGQVTYKPNNNFNGMDSFTYTISDGALTHSASVTVTVLPVDDVIDAMDDEATTTDEDPVEIDVLQNDTDVDTDKANNLAELHSSSDFRLTAVGKASYGTAEILNGKITYTPNDRFAGKDQFTYTVTDGHSTSNTATVTVTVVSVNDAPEILVVSAPVDGTKAIPPDPVHVAWTSFDIEGDVLTYSLDYFDGTNWLAAASGLTKAEYDFAIPATLASTSGLKFRVSAYDGELTSNYGYSGMVQVDKDAPTGTVVTMRTADGRAYTAGTWTNQNVTVQAASSVDASKVTYYYSMDGAAEEAADSMSVTSGVHTVYVTARDEFKNQTALGGYIARVDKLQPAIPQMRESISGANVVVSFTLQADPGGSGNAQLILPDGTTLNASGTLQFTTAKNGTYSFTLVDAVGNRRVFTYTVGSADTSKPQISYASGAYRVGTTSQNDISVTLSFTDGESTIVARGYQLSTGSSPSGTYRNYDGTISISKAGSYYIHAFARNAFGLTTYETFGPFILEEAPLAPAAGVTPTPQPTIGSVVVTTEDVKEEIPGGTVAIRLPGKEWSETLTLENVAPGDYLVEVMDENGNVSTVTVHVTQQDIVARSIRGGNNAASIAVISALAVAAAAAIMLMLLFTGYNVIVTVTHVPFTEERKIRAMRRIMFQKKEFVIDLEKRHVVGGKFAKIKLAKYLTKKMRGNWIIVRIQGVEVLREQIPEDADKAFIRKIGLNQQ